MFTMHLFSFVVCAVVAAPPAAEEKAALRLVRAIPLNGVAGGFDHLAHDARGKRLFIACKTGNEVVAVDLASGKITARLPKPKTPRGLCVLSESGRLAVASGGDGKLRIYAADLTLLGFMEGLDGADNVRYDAAKRRVWVGYGGGALLEVEPGMLARKREVKLDGHPESFQLERRGGRMFVNVPSAGHVAVIDRTSGKVTAKWPVTEAKENYPMALDEAGARLFIACRKPAMLLVLDTQTGKTVASAACVGDADDLFFDSARKRIYVVGGEGFVSVFERGDAGQWRPVARIATETGARTGLFVEEARRLYVAVPARGGRPAEVREYAAED